MTTNIQQPKAALAITAAAADGMAVLKTATTYQSLFAWLSVRFFTRIEFFGFPWGFIDMPAK